VDSDNSVIQNLTKTITEENMADMDKVKAVHNWVTNNITYDTAAYYNGTPGMNTASEVIQAKKGTCRDYSFAFASLARAAGVPTRVVYGDAWNNALQTYEKHAWNEALVDGKWISIDTTWDAGYIRDKKFVIASTEKFLNMDADTFNQTHKITSITLF
jgi:transglutaminase-like putative cysteine protease